MLFSKGDAIWMDLSTFFINVDRLLIFLKQDQFTGYVQFENQDKCCLILFDEGDVVAGAEKKPYEAVGKAESVNEIVAHATEDESLSISIFSLSDELMQIFVDVYNTETKVIHKSLHSDFSDIPKFILKMQKKKFNGYIYFNFLKVEKNGIIVLKDGNLDAIITQDVKLTSSDSETSRMKYVKMILSESKITGAEFSVFQFS